MHEASLVMSMLEIAEREARAAGATRIALLRVQIGAASSVVPEAFAHAFDALRGGTLAGDAELAIERTPAHFVCIACGEPFTALQAYADCPVCGAPGLTHPDEGRSLQLVSLEVD